jgi:hypothetical protein
MACVAGGVKAMSIGGLPRLSPKVLNGPSMSPDDFLHPPDEVHFLPSQSALFERIQTCCHRTEALLQEEDLDGLRLKAFGDQLDSMLEEMDMLSRTQLPQTWVMAGVEYLQELLGRVRQVQTGLLEE